MMHGQDKVTYLNEVEMVSDDIRVILNKFENDIQYALEEIITAKAWPHTPEAFASLNRAQDKLSKINLNPVIDTIEGMIENEANNDSIE